MTMNRPLSNWPEAQALASRIDCLEYNPSDNELASLMRQIAKHRHDRLRLSAEECTKVIDFVIKESKRARVKLHLRMIEQAYTAYAMDDAESSFLTWKDTVSSNICEYDSIVDPLKSAGRRAATKEAELKLLTGLQETTPEERLAIWKDKTGKSPASMYRRLEELRQMEPLNAS